MLSRSPLQLSRPCARCASTFSSLRASVRGGDVEAYHCGALLPSSARDSFFALRALSLELAGVRDAVRGNATAGHLRIAFWRDVVDCAWRPHAETASPAAAGAGAHPLVAPLAAAVARHTHTRRWVDRLIDARDAELDARAPSTVADLEAFGEATQSSLLYLSLEAVGMRDVHADHAASHIGKAIALATILRALPVHCRMGQRYLPDELLFKHGLTEADILPTQRVEVAAASAAASGRASFVHSGIRVVESRAATRLKEGAFTIDSLPPPRASQAPPSVGDDALLSPRVVSALRDVTFDLATIARAHVEHARSLAPTVPLAARAALLPALPVSRFLSRLEAQDFDVFAAGRGEVWQDGRPHARLLLQGSLLWATVCNAY